MKSFVALGKDLLANTDANFLLSEVFSQDPLESYFSAQRHKGGSCDNPTVEQFHQNAPALMQQKGIYSDLKTMNVCMPNEAANYESMLPLPKRRKKH